MQCMRSSVVVGLVLMCAQIAGAQVVSLELTGSAGEGLLPGNENHAVVGGGTGGLGIGGITYDPDTNLLTIDARWGSGNGFTDLSGAATAAHIHGATPSSAPDGFAENAGVLYNLSGLLDNSASNGSIIGNVTISEDDEGFLLGGQTYINVHTAANGAGEIRGQLTVVPEPHEYAMVAGVGLALFAIGRRRRLSQAG